MSKDLDLILQREAPTSDDTLGVLFIDDRFVCFTLEDTLREVPGKPVESWKVYGQTAIPAGRYRVTIVPVGAPFNRNLPLLHDVPGYTGILLHPGATAGDTLGCILLGLQRATAMITSSRPACDLVQQQIEGAIAAGREVWITVLNPPGWWQDRLRQAIVQA
jgi:hypothetical protein